MRKILLAIAVFVLTSAMAWAAGPMPDTLFVHFTDPVVVSQSLTLNPGNYKFQRLSKPTDPAVFTIIDADNGKVIGTTPPADLAQRGGGADVAAKGYVILDQVDGKDYLDTAYLQGLAHGFMFQQPSNIRQMATSRGTQIKVEAQTGGQD